MRMHRKSHLDERLEKRSDLLTVADITEKNMKKAVEMKNYLPLEQIFQNSNPVHLEIGCGKGKFVLEMAKKHPDVNFIAVEKISNVIIDGVESVYSAGLKNVHFLNSSAEVLQRFIKDGTVSRIYLNFSNPLPKLGYTKQRLTHPRFLQIYKNLLVDGGEIWQKTDNEGFFEFSLESYGECGFQTLEVCRDLKNANFLENVITEHEQRFMDDGLPIFRVVARLKKDAN